MHSLKLTFITRGFVDKLPDKRLDYRELMNRLRSPRNGLGDIYQMDLSALKISG